MKSTIAMADYVLVLLVVLVGCGGIGTGAGSVDGGNAGSPNPAKMTKAEVKAKIAALSGNFDPEVLDAAVGKPTRTRTESISSYWTWVCSDGTVEMRCVFRTKAASGNKTDMVFVTEVNDR